MLKNHRKLSTIVVLVMLTCINFNLHAKTKIHYRGEHFGKAWIDVNGRLTKLVSGQTSKSGVTLLSFNEDEIVINVDGGRYRYLKGSNKGVVLEEEVVLQRDPDNGSYWASGRINDKAVTFLVDTGASYVTLSKELAGTLKIKHSNRKLDVYSATKKETVYAVILERVSIGGIEIRNVQGIITRHQSPIVPLLGMSFLKNVEISQAGEQMRLKYTSE